MTVMMMMVVIIIALIMGESRAFTVIAVESLHAHLLSLLSWRSMSFLKVVFTLKIMSRSINVPAYPNLLLPHVQPADRSAHYYPLPHLDQSPFCFKISLLFSSRRLHIVKIEDTRGKMLVKFKVNHPLPCFH